MSKVYTIAECLHRHMMGRTLQWVEEMLEAHVSTERQAAARLAEWAELQHEDDHVPDYNVAGCDVCRVLKEYYKTRNRQ
jgi:hypothetical protein